jgi:DNA-binding NtrC family response regulator
MTLSPAPAGRGVSEQADGGMLFLDEIGDMPLAMQIKLLRMPQERRITRLGGEKSVAVDLRLKKTHVELPDDLAVEHEGATATKASRLAWGERIE